MFSRSRIWMACVELSMLAILAVLGRKSHADGPSTPADDWMTELVAAEIKGDTALRAKVLEKVVAERPDLSIAHWQLGQIEVDGEWQSVEAVQQAAAADPRQIEYASLRANAGESMRAQLNLARWCQKNDLAEEGRVHWLNVLAAKPDSGEALRALDVEWFQGELLPREEAARQKADLANRERSLREWLTKLADWQQRLAGDLPERTAALSEIREIRDPKAALVIERVTLDQSIADDTKIVRQRQISSALLDALEDLPSPIAIQSQLRHAVFSPQASVRRRAIEDLKQRPMQDYVPYLLNDLAAPIESKYSVQTGMDGTVQYAHSLYRTGRQADWSFNGTRELQQRDLQGQRTYVRLDGTRIDLGNEEQVQREMVLTAAAYRQRYAAQAASVEQSLRQANEVTRARNWLVLSLLVATTGQELGEDPRDWWNWWDEYREDYAYGSKPVYDYRYRDEDTNYYGRSETFYEPAPPRPLGRCECFVKGTPVWTKLGLRPIEELRIGDLVLSQDVESGELAYKPLLGTTIRPPSEIISFQVGTDRIGATQGHPIWVAGQGWKMVKELENGSVVRCSKESTPVRSIGPAGMAEAYNLIVADFNTYFVGESGVLVHDRTPTRPTASAVPGIAKTND